MYKKCIKRLLDITFSLVTMPFAFFAFLIVAPLIYIEDKGPIFYVAHRLGKHGNVYKMYKFRSMYINAPDIRNADGSTYSGKDDPRVTKIGRIMRKTSVDEIPQLLNVLRGDMSFIGPRPNLANKGYDSFDEIRKKRVSVRPGITGYSQAYFRNSISMVEKFDNDCYYVDHISFILDLKILIRSIVSVLLRKNIYSQAPGGNVSRSGDYVSSSIDEKSKQGG